MKKQIKGVIYILLSSLAFGSYGVWSRLIGDDFGIFFQAWTRALMIVIGVTPFLFYIKQVVPIRKDDWKWMAVLLTFTALTQAPLFYAFNHMNIGTASLLFFVSMLLTMYTVGIFFLGERINKIKAWSFVLAVVGLLVIFYQSIMAFTLFAGFMAIVNGIASGGEVSFSKKLTGDYSALYITWLAWIVIFITNAPISVFMGEIQHAPEISMVWFYQGCYTIAGLLAFYLVIEGLKNVESSIGGLLGLLEVVFAVLFGVLLFNENLSLNVAIGGGLIAFAAALPYLKQDSNSCKC